MKAKKIFELREGYSFCLILTLTHPFFRRISRQKSQRDREEEELKRQLSAPGKLIEDEDTEEGSVSNLSLMAAWLIK